MKKENILHISRTMGQGGAEKIIFQLSVGLKEKFNKTLVASTGGELIDDMEENGIEHVRIEDIEQKSIPVLLKNFIQLFKIIKNNNINIVHIHHRMGLLYVQLLRIFYPRIRYVYTAHNIFVDKSCAYKLLLRNIKIVAVGNGVYQSLINRTKVSEVGLQKINNCIPADKSLKKIPVEFRDNDSIKILCVARLSAQKGIDYLLKAFSLIADKNVHLFILGDGELNLELYELSKELHIDNQVTFLGYRRNVYDYIKYCDFMVLPSLWEGLPLTPIECFMNSKTIIATSIPGTTDIVNNENGILVKRGNIEELAEAITLLAQDESLRKNKELKALQTYTSKFSYQKFIDNYWRVYHT